MSASPTQTNAGAAARGAVALETARLRLRPFTLGDLGALCRITADAEVMRYIGDGFPLTPAETEANLRNIMDAFQRRGYGRWALEEKAGGALLGYCGLGCPAGSPGTELVYMLARGAWGRGLASEASAAVLRFAFEEVGLEHVYALTMPGNVRSRRVLERLGMEYLREDRYFGYDCVCYALTRERWRGPGLYRVRNCG